MVYPDFTILGVTVKKPEILAPAGNLEKLKFAVAYGADAVYCAGKRFGLRAGAGNFSLAELQEGLEFAQGQGKKVYVTVNIFAHNEDLIELPSYLADLQRLGVDALLVSDPGVIALSKEYAPDIPLHLSTQANNTNWAAARFWQEQGIERLVAARELRLEEIREIKQKTGLELEAFVHGAMCISYSGRCLLSSYLIGRDANRGDCAHPCRWRYALVEEKRPGEFLPIEEDDRGSYILNSKDLCMLPYIPELLRAGIDSLKIEGRMKSIHYVATVVKAYRQAVDSYYCDPEGYVLHKEWLEELAKTSNRQFTTGFFFEKPGPEEHNYQTSIYTRDFQFIGVILDYDDSSRKALVEQRNHFQLGEMLEVMNPTLDNFTFKLTSLEDEAGQALETAPHPKQKVWVEIPHKAENRAVLRRPPREINEKAK